MISNYADLIPLVTAELPNCPAPLVLQHLRQAGRNLCADSESWREDITMDTVKGQAAYILKSKWDAEVRRVIDVWTNGDKNRCPVHPSYYDFDQRTNTLTFKPAGVPTAATTGGLIITVALVPSLFASELAGWFMERHNEAIVNGCKANLMVMKNKAWTDRDLAAHYMNEYRHSVVMARCEKLDQNKQQMHRVQFQPFV